MKKSLLLILGLLLTTSLFAGPVGKEEAKAKALAFLNGTVSQRAGVAKAPRRLQDLSLASSGDAYHVFNIGASNGFVIVSGSDLTPDIIGYTDEGAFDAQNIPDNMKEWLQEYTNQIAWMEKQGEATASASKVRKAPAGVKAAIAPLIQTKWNQGNPYNYYCPNFVTSTKCVTGCMATALAQLLYYHHQKDGFPTGTKADVAEYDCFTNWSGSYVHVDACPASDFAWDKMQLTYTGKEEAASDAKAQAVAKLMQYCGAAINMDYADESNGGSSASSDIVEPLITYFGFDERVKLCSRTNYTIVEWESLIYQELVEKRPVILTGQSTGGGHAFICDGYDADGYFHINWGWGGTGNGYYLLNIANPHETGIGAGTSSDGYTMKQDALIGLEKPVGSVPTEVELGRLTMSELNYLGETVVARSAEFQLSYHFKVVNRLSSAHDFQFTLAVFDKDDNCVALPSSYIPVTLNTKQSAFYDGHKPQFNFSTSKLPSGTYRVKMVSRFKGETEWYPCFESEDYYIQMVADESNLTFTTVNPSLDLAVSDVSPLDCVKGEVTTITATITNNGSNFNSNLYLFLSGSSDPVSGNGVSVEAGKKTVASFAFKYDGEAPAVKTMKIATNKDGTGEIWSGSLNVVAGVTGTDAPALTFSTKLNKDGDKILGNKLIGVVTATNNTDGNYTGDITLVRHLYEGIYDKSSWIWKNVTVPAHSSVDINFEYDVEMDKEYGAEVKYKHGGSEVSVYTDKKYIAKPAVKVLASDGKETLKLATANFTVPADVAVVDLRGQSVVTSVVPNSNPNCLYLLDESAAIPAGISNNVVKGATAANIVLKDGYDFYTPIDFTATKISYTRTFTTGANKTGGGWNTILLPFDVTAVKQGTTPIDWFKSTSDTGKNFWVYAFANDDETNVEFNYADAIKAYTPYLINVPSDAWGAENQLTGKPITFEGENAVVMAEAKSASSGSRFIFSGDMQQQAVSQCYVLNATGTQFEKTVGNVPAFQAYFYSTTRDWLGGTLSISFVDNSEATGIQSVDTKQVAADDDSWYTLQGMKLDGKPTEKGIYIYNGKKVAIK